MKSPNVARNCDQFVIRTGLLKSPLSAKPTKAATDVATPVIVRTPLAFSTM